MVYIWFVCKYELINIYIYYIYVNMIVYIYIRNIENILINIRFKPKKQNNIHLDSLHPQVPKQKLVWPPSIPPGNPHIQAPWWSQHWVSWHPLPPPSLQMGSDDVDGLVTVSWLAGWVGQVVTWWLGTKPRIWWLSQIVVHLPWAPIIIYRCWLISPSLLKNMMRTSIWIMKPQGLGWN